MELIGESKVEAIVELNIYEPNLRKYFCPICNNYLGESEKAPQDIDFKFSLQCPNCRAVVGVPE